MVRIRRCIGKVDELKGEQMGHAIVWAILGICGWLLPKEEKQRIVEKEATEWLEERR